MKQTGTSARRRPPSQGKVAGRPGWGGCVVQIGQFRIRKYGLRYHQHPGRGNFGSGQQQCTKGTTVRFVSLIVDVRPFAVVGRFTHRMRVVQQQIMQAVQRPGSRETQGQKKGSQTPR